MPKNSLTESTLKKSGVLLSTGTNLLIAIKSHAPKSDTANQHFFQIDIPIQ